VTTLTAERLVKEYSAGVTAVSDFSLTVAPGELVALVGPSGCGKTTVLRMIAGLVAPTSGDITFNGQSVVRVPPQKRGAVMVFQQHQLFPFMSVADNIAFGLRIQKLDRASIGRRIREVLEMVQLPTYGNRLPDQLSGGQRQRIALARALALRPRLLLLDEPLSGLEAGLREELRDMIRRLQQETGITTVFVTHDQTEAVAIADRLALMLKGRLKQVDVPRNCFERPLDAEVARFFGGANILPGTKCGHRVLTGLCPLEVDSELPDGQVLAMIRPESILIGEGTHNTVKMCVTAYSYQGVTVRCITRSDCAAELQLAMAPHTKLRVGDEIVIHIPRDRIWVVPAGVEDRTAAPRGGRLLPQLQAG
jgi:ABC-type Fe3+/spermidine/putrescine transport system ATPase subunit